jgi:outer membrane protein assembly factor BamD (BamD/ComL family)
MKQLVLVFIMVCVLAVSACSENKAGELFETAQFEELQRNHEHAMQLYKEIIEKHAGSEYAKKAEDRLSELRKNETNR